MNQKNDLYTKKYNIFHKKKEKQFLSSFFSFKKYLKISIYKNSFRQLKQQKRMHIDLILLMQLTGSSNP